METSRKALSMYASALLYLELFSPPLFQQPFDDSPNKLLNGLFSGRLSQQPIHGPNRPSSLATQSKIVPDMLSDNAVQLNWSLAYHYIRQPLLWQD